MKTVIRVGYLFAIIGLIMLVVGGVLYSKKKAIIANSAFVTGKVVEVERRRSTDSDGYSAIHIIPFVNSLPTKVVPLFFPPVLVVILHLMT